MKLTRGDSIPHEKYLPRFEAHVRFENYWGNLPEYVDYSFPTLEEMLIWADKVDKMTSDEHDEFFKYVSDQSFDGMSFLEFTKENVCYRLERDYE